MDDMTLSVGTAAVRVGGLSRRYGATRALDEVELTLGRGVTGLLGPNGAGKTTLLSILATVAAPDAGQLSVLGHAPADPGPGSGSSPCPAVSAANWAWPRPCWASPSCSSWTSPWPAWTSSSGCASAS